MLTLQGLGTSEKQNDTFNRILFAKYIGILLNFTENLDLK